jgi:4'-phosphopantetheinyl transferase
MQTCNITISVSNIKSVELVASQKYSVDANNIIIYTIYLPNFVELKADLAKFLNSNELDRAERYHKETDRNRFIICRSILKFVLAAHTKLDVKNISFAYDFNKKPYLDTCPSLSFNISHSGDFAVIAISPDKVGIDIEYISEDFAFLSILPDIFDDNEIWSIENAVNQKHAFYTLWTRKEAFVKALGKGIDDDFKAIPCLDGQHSIDSSILKSTDNWQVCSFDIADHYMAAVAFESLSTITPNLVAYTIPNTMKALIEMALR